jgi:S1-C subfamily serine protease
MRRLAAIALVAAGCGGARSEVLPVRVPTGPLSTDHATAVPIGGGRALTVAHVLSPGRPVFVGGHAARVVRVDGRLDLAVLAVPGLRAPAPPHGTARAGEHVKVRALRGALPAVVRRVVTAHEDGSDRPVLELSAAVLPGDSGAPVVDGHGRVLGVVYAGAAGGLAYAVRTDSGLPPPPARLAPSG